MAISRIEIKSVMKYFISTAYLSQSPTRHLNGARSDYSELISAFINRLFLPYFPGAAETIPFPYGVRTIDKDGPRNLQTL